MADDAKIDYISNKLDAVSNKVSDIHTKLEVHITKFDIAVDNAIQDRAQIARNTDVLDNNTQSLQDHMRRTEILEDYVKKIDDRFTPVEMEALRKKAVAEWVNLKLKLIAKVGAAVGAMGSIGLAAKYLVQFWLNN